MDDIENKEIINENELNDIGDEIPLLKQITLRFLLQLFFCI